MAKVKNWGIDEAETNYYKLAKSIKDFESFDDWQAHMMTSYHLLQIAYPEEQDFEDMNREQWDEFQDLHKD